MPAVILEGPEKAGKSTLAKQIIEEWNGPHVHIHHGKGDSVPNRLDGERMG